MEGVVGKWNVWQGNGTHGRGVGHLAGEWNAWQGNGTRGREMERMVREWDAWKEDGAHGRGWNLLARQYKGKRVLVTGHTGFKGSWLCMMLRMLGADVTGYALEPEAGPSLFQLANISETMDSVIGDVRDLNHMKRVFDACKPEFVFHLAAQPIVRESYKDPVGTYSVNVMGTVHLMECVRLSGSVRSVVNVTTDKVYENRETDKGYTEEDRLDGYDPYSNSKSCSELVAHSYVNSFLREQGVAVSACRAGNVVGGGDFSKDRIVPDCVRAAIKGVPLTVRNPLSVRPYQHVLEPLSAYLLVAAGQSCSPHLAGAYNIGPKERGCLKTGELAELFRSIWGRGFTWESKPCGGPHEAGLLKLDCRKIKNAFGWKPCYDAEQAVRLVVEWTRAWLEGEDAGACMERQIRAYAAEQDMPVFRSFQQMGSEA